MPSFDVVCQVDNQEVNNAVNNANKEITNRYDFRNTDTVIDWKPDDSVITIDADSDGRAQAAYDVLQSKLVRRDISLKALKPQKIHPAAGGRVRQDIEVQQGIPQEVAKKMIKEVKNAKIKVQGSIQGDQVRFSGKKRDDLQAVIGLLKEQDYELPLSFVNFRD